MKTKRTGKISRKLIIAFVIVTMIGSLANTITSVQSYTNSNRYAEIVEDYGFSQGYIGRAMMALTDTRGYLYDMISAKTDEEVAIQELNLANARAQHDQYAVLADATVTVDSEMDILTRLKAGVGEYYAVQDEWVARLKATPADEREKLRGELGSIIDPMYEELFLVHGELLDSKVTLGTEEVTHVEKMTDIADIVSICLATLTIAAGVIVGVVFSRRIIHVIKELVECSKELRAGKLDGTIEVESNDELGTLADNFRAMQEDFSTVVNESVRCLGELSKGNFNFTPEHADKFNGDFTPLLTSLNTIKSNLSSTLAEIDSVAEQVSMGSDQVASTAQALSQGSTEQAAAVQELSATVNDINNHVHETGERATAASEKTAEAGRLMIQCDAQMKEMVSAMGRISHASEEISKIIKTIEDIAFQTNILALNAAVEAARAGTAGKGFAVVADEVRNLAAKSAEASKNTSDLIEAAITAVAEGAEIANNTAGQLQSVAASAKEVSEAVEDIANASREQANSINQIATGIDQISAVVQTNSATAEESAAASEELSGQANMLKDLVGQFKF